MSKHTPGPWEVDDTCSRCVVPAGGMGRIAMCHGDSVPPDEEDANAALIAAAPEMLAALRRLFKACGHMPIEATPESAEMMMAGLDAVRAVIKATGEEP